MEKQAPTRVRLLVGLRAVEVTLGYVGAADAHLANLPNGHQAVLQVQNAHLQQHRQRKASAQHHEAGHANGNRGQPLHAD